ncbi:MULTISPECIES: hypothetical protein [Rahnella]|uniref:Transmembrane protein n=1 Tax=Rahnella laticis TaxID=2787622 RepID=A0ABS0EA75_9GAMM|nr:MULTISPECIES: hypothetical protein [Rahnella]MBF7981980.1 hypothetical protein [Rahnella laticis]MBF8002070.1 hypothetical protein [Rahnella sp. LAC-M12]
MQFLRKILSCITALFKTEDQLLDVEVFPKIEPEKLKKNLQIAEQAKRHGANGLPHETATELTDTEHSIQATLGKIREGLVKWATAALKQNQDRLNTIDITGRINRTILLGEEYERDADQLISSQSAMLAELREIAISKANELDFFKSKNKLTRTAQLRNRGAIFLHGTLVLACIAIEGIMNSSFFAEGLSSGLVGGFLFAVSLSGLNVLTCFIMGRFATFKNHISLFQRLFGHAAILTILTLTIILGLITAHIRDALPLVTDTTESAWVIAKETLVSTPFILHDISSYILWVLTIVFGLIAGREGYTFSDPYPGYAKLYRTYEEIQRDYINAVASLNNDLDIHKTKILDSLDSNVTEATKDIANFKRNMKMKLVTKKRLDQGMLYADETLKSLIKMYRMENMMARIEKNTYPKYFDEPVNFDLIQYPNFGISQDEIKLNEQEQLMAEMISKIETIRAKIQASFNQKHDQLQPLQQLV